MEKFNRSKIVESLLNQSRANFVELDGVNSMEDYEKYLINHFTPTLHKWMKSYFGVNLPIPSITFGRHGLEFEIPIDKKDMGIFAQLMDWTTIHLFNGGKLETKEENGKFLVSDSIWIVPTVGFQTKTGGSNGIQLLTKFNNQIWYNPLTDEIIGL